MICNKESGKHIGFSVSILISESVKSEDRRHRPSGTRHSSGSEADLDNISNENNMQNNEPMGG